MSQVIELKKQIITELRYIDPANGYTNKAKDVIDGYRSVTDVNQMDIISLWTRDDKNGDYYNSNVPGTIEPEIIIDTHCAETQGISLTDKVELWKLDIRKWLYQGSGITANKWLTIGESANDTNTGAAYKEFISDGFQVGRSEDSKYALIRCGFF